MIDDEPAVRDIAGFEVLSASGGREGIEIFQRRRRDIQAVLVDMMMPGLQGEEVVARLRQLDPAVRIVVMSGLLTSAQQIKEEPGRLIFLQKPITVEELFAAVRQLLPDRRSS